MISFECKTNQIMRHRPEGVLKIKPSDVAGQLLVFCIPDHFMNNLIMLHTSILALEECLLVGGVYKIIVFYASI